MIMAYAIQQTNKGQYTVTLPKALTEAMGWSKGTQLQWKVVGSGKLELTRL